MLREGDSIPEVTLTGPENQAIGLQDLLGPKVLVLYFYPKDDTPGCTAEACSFRDQYEDFLAAGADVVGVSSDTVASHEGFSSKFRLPFRLLSDAEGKARKAFGVKATLGLLPGRATFVIDRTGVIRYAWSSQIRATEHVRRALEVVRSLA